MIRQKTIREMIGKVVLTGFVLTASGAFVCGLVHAQAGEKVDTAKYGSHAKDIEELQKKLEKDPDNIDFLMELGKVYGWAEDQKSAIRTYERVVSLKPDYLEARKKLFDFYRWDDQEEKAVPHGEFILKQEPGNIPIMEKLGNYYLYHNQTEKAEALFREIIQKDPNNKEARMGLAELDSINSRNDEAIRTYQEILKSTGTPRDRQDILDRVSDNYYATRDYGKAREYAEEALRLDPQDKDAQRRLKKIDELYRPTLFSEYKYRDYKGDEEREYIDVGWIQPTKSGVTVTGIYHNYRRWDQEDESVERYGYDSGALELSKYVGDGLTVSVGGEGKFYTTDAAEFDYYLRAVKDFNPNLRGDFLYEKRREDLDFERLVQNVDAHAFSGTFYHDLNDWFSLHSNLEGTYYTQGDTFSDNFRLAGYVSPVFHIIKEQPRFDVYYTYYRIFTLEKDQNGNDTGEKFEYFAPRRYQEHSVTLYLQHNITKQLEIVASDTVTWVDDEDFNFWQNSILGEIILKLTDNQRLSVRYITTHHVHNGSETDYKNDEWRAQYSYRF